MAFEIEPDPDEPILIGTKIAYVIEYIFPRLSLWMKDKECGCDIREQWLNDKHWELKEYFNLNK